MMQCKDLTRILLPLLLWACVHCSAAVEYRLTTDVVPESYEITLTPYLPPSPQNKQFTFDGEVMIKLHAVVENVKSITVHKDFMDILSTTLYDEAGVGGTLIENVTDTEYETATDKYTVFLQQPLMVNRTYSLHFTFNGLIRETMAGLFYGSYKSNDTVKYIALTQMQRINARNVFPCFDEPALKAKFKMHINRQKEYNAMFNTRLVESKPMGDDRYLDTFEETPPMSTYLTAFLISDHGQRTENNVTIAVTREYLHRIDYAMNVSAKAIEAYSDYTNLPYHELGIELFQQAGSPRFPHNGMENWGLILYQDEVLVHDLDFTLWSDRQFTVEILFHEIAHNWFGNSVTFKWWSYFWLNEAFARYFQWYMADVYYPEMGMRDQFVIKQVHLIFGTDATISTQPLTTPEHLVNTPSEVAKMFSGIAYAKGASILRMFEGLMGSKNFQTALQDYLKEMQLSAVVPEDLFKHLKAHWPQNHQVNLTQFFSDWTEQNGFPMLIVKGSPNITDSSVEIRLEQKRFLLNPADGSNPDLTYTIPITYATNLNADFANRSPAFYFNKTAREMSFTIENNGFQWIVFNVQQNNYHRVFYDGHYLRAIKTALSNDEFRTIDVISRTNIIDDLFNFAHSELIDYAQVLDFMEYMERETEYLPWYAAFQGLQRITPYFTVEQNTLFAQYMWKIGRGVFEHLGLRNDNDSVLMIYNRNAVITWLCKLQHKECNAAAEEWFRKIIAGEEALPIADFRETLYCSAIRFSDLQMYHMLEALMKSAKSPREQDAILRAMGCTFHHYQEHYLKIINRELRQDQNAWALKSIYTQNQPNVYRLMELILETVDKLIAALGSPSAAANAISDLANYITSNEELILLHQLIDESGDLFGTSVNTLKSAVTKVERNMVWAEQRLALVNYYLSSNFGGATAIQSVAMLIFTFVGLLCYFI